MLQVPGSGGVIRIWSHNRVLWRDHPALWRKRREIRANTQKM